MSRDDFTRFYADNKDRCLRAAVAGGMERDAAEEAVAEAFARAWARWRTVSTHESPAAWVVRTAVNANISSWRKRRRELLSDQPTEGAAEHRDDSVDLVAAIRRLPARQRDVVILRYLLDLDTATTAAQLGIATGTVTAHLHHALATLRAHLTHENDTETEGAHR